MATKVEALKELYAELGGSEAGAAGAETVAGILGYVADAAGDVVDSIPSGDSGGCEVIVIEKKDGSWQNSPKTAPEIIDLMDSGKLVKIFLKYPTYSTPAYEECVIARAGDDGDGGKAIQYVTLKYKWLEADNTYSVDINHAFHIQNNGSIYSVKMD